MPSRTTPSSVAANSNWSDARAAPRCGFDDLKFENHTLVIKERTVDLAELHNHLQICKPLGVWYLELNGVTLVDPSSVTPHTTIISRPWLKSLVIRSLKRSTPDVLVKFLSLFQQIQELHFEGSIGPELHLAPADEDENLERVVVKKLVVHSTYNLPPVSIAESSPKWPGIFIALRKIVQLSGLQTFETNANPWILKEFLQPCEETLRSLTFSVHRTEDNLDFGLRDFIQLQHLHITDVLLPLCPSLVRPSNSEVQDAVGCALRTLATILAQVSKTENERATLRTLEADIVYRPIGESEKGERREGDRRKQLSSTSIQVEKTKEKAEILAVFNSYPSLTMLVEIPEDNNRVRNMLKARFCPKKSTNPERFGFGLSARALLWRSSAPTDAVMPCHGL